MAVARDEIGQEKRILSPALYPSVPLGQVFGAKVNQVTKLNERGEPNKPSQHITDADAADTPQESSHHRRL